MGHHFLKKPGDFADISIIKAVHFIQSAWLLFA
jgi:hypothetical protein